MDLHHDRLPINLQVDVRDRVVMERRPRVAEVAAKAGVSTATVDRVINGRGGVRGETVARVERAIGEITKAVSARPLPRRLERRTIDVLLPGNSGRSTEVLAEQMAEAARSFSADVAIDWVTRMDPAALAAQLAAVADRGRDCVAFQAIDHPIVRAAVQDLRNAEVKVVTLCSDIAGIDRAAYVGMDNRAAGRTAGWLMGRLCRGPGKIAVIWGGQLYRSHEERGSGFRAVLRHDHPDIEVLEIFSGRDDPRLNFDIVIKTAAEYGDLKGIYCVGGGQSGVAAALEEAGLARSVTFIGHNFNEETKPFLLSGTLDAVIHQDMSRIAADALRALLTPEAVPTSATVPVELITRENMPPLPRRGAIKNKCENEGAKP